MIRLDNVSKFYYSKGVIASGFSKVSLNFEIGEFVAITGESGSGKSTLLNVISGLDTYEEGELYIDGKETSHYTEKDFEDYRRKYIGNIFQNFNLVNSYTVYQNIELVLLLNGLKKKEIKERINELIKKVGLWEYRNSKVSKLSGGQKQRVAIARTLAKDTPIIIADEPTGNLDSESAAGIIKLLAELAEDKLVIVVTHNYDQVEPYVTRKIKMHDGKVLEDLQIKEYKSPETVSQVEYKSIRPMSQLRLGVRNAFNIPVKFLLLVFVFLFIATAIVTELSLFKHEEFENSVAGYNYFFNINSENRIVIKKNDGSAFSADDYEKISKLENVDKVIENDLLVDFSRGISDKKNFYYYASVRDLDDIDFDTVDLGRMPKSDYEILLTGRKNSYSLSNDPEGLIGKKVYIEDWRVSDTGSDMPLTIVGVKYTDDKTASRYSDCEMYVSDKVLDNIKYSINMAYSTTIVEMNGKEIGRQNDDYSSINIMPNKSVKSGEAYVGEAFAMNFNTGKGNIKGKTATVKVENIYYDDSFDVTITQVLRKGNFKSMTGIKGDYEMFADTLFVSTEDYNKLFDKPSFQSSVFVKDPLRINETAEQLRDMDINAFVIKDANVQDGEGVIFRIMSIGVTAGLAVALFFISYFVIRIILKSRNVYYSTVRMLGGTVGVSRNLLIIDLLTDANIACAAVFGVIKALQTRGYDNFILEAITKYMTVWDYTAIYAIVIGISLLISIRYSRSLFKKSSMATFKEEV